MNMISRQTGKMTASMLMAILFVLLLFSPVKGTNAEATAALTATRCISPDDITPGSTFNVKVILNVSSNKVEQLELDEDIPSGWTVVRTNDGGAKFAASKLNTSNLNKWSWPSVSAGETKTVEYDVRVPSSAATGRAYPISGKICASDVAATSVGGELAVVVTTAKIHHWVGFVAIVVIVLCFGMILYLGWREDHKLDKGEMRRAIAGTFVIGFTILTILCLNYRIYQTEILLAYIELVGIVIGFYFGAKTAAGKRAEASAKIGIEHLRFPDPDRKKIAITIRNGGDTEIKVDKVYVNEKAFETDVKIDSQKSKEIEQPCEWNYETEYTIKIVTTTGLASEISRLSPKKT